MSLFGEVDNGRRERDVRLDKAADALTGHAGDISSQGVLDRLRITVPVYAARGNADKEWAAHLTNLLDFELGDLRVYHPGRSNKLRDF